jgi:RNA polymerase sigma-70 factor (ECF subfamily)
LSADRIADEEAIARVLSGDREAFAVLVDRHGARIHGAVLRMIGDPEAARDLAQETLLRAYAGLGSFRRGSAFYTWLYAIAVNQVRTEFRRRRSVKGQAMLPLDAGRAADGDSEEGAAGAAEPESRGPGPDEEAARHDEARRVQRALARLDEEFREAVVLRDLEGLSYEEIAEATGVPAGTVRSRIHRGRAALRELLLPAGGRVGGAS